VKTAPIHPAEIHFGSDGAPPTSALYGDVYHPRAGAIEQAAHVFLRGNGLPHRWTGRRRFVVLETGFGLGHNFLATWASWRAHPERCERLVFVSIEAHPPHEADLRRVHTGSDLAALATQLCDAWPRSTANLHLRRFEEGRVELLLAWGDVHAVLPELSTPADAFFLDGFAPDRNPGIWDASVLKALGRLALPDATLATWSVARSVHEGLSSAGFAVSKAPGFAHKREMTVARFSPRPGMRTAARRMPASPDGPREAMVIGAGLAGASVAQALVARGWACTVVEAARSVAQGASGNALGLYHGSQNAHDGLHARWHRAAALHLERCLAEAAPSSPPIPAA
jgi:tRNA 5-methylaminomethyl-2-thiouridine biosynthesis bifunctional protein